ncbi:hypothetical protein [Streptomyces sp. NPDC093094]|uniref:hypothetical protein n=1 Tax=Streptomyces sp. NPDC093094 TaxID=3366026 RepID=UPI0038075663
MADAERGVVRPLLPVVPAWLRGRGGQSSAAGVIDSQSVKADAVVGADGPGVDGTN